VASQKGDHETRNGIAAARKRLVDAQSELRKFQAAIAAGVDPSAVVDAINAAQAERVAAQAEIDNTPGSTLMDAGEVYARIDALGDIPTTLNDATGERLADLYTGLDLRVLYEPDTSIAEVSMRVNSVRVRGGT
jgi:hypothetical protein